MKKEITENEIFQMLKQIQLENVVNMTDDEIDKANLDLYKDQCQKYMWLKLYIKRMMNDGINEFRLVIHSPLKNPRTAMIHPLGKDGETLDFDL